MRLVITYVVGCCLLVPAFAAEHPLKGYRFAAEERPTGKEWNSPEDIALNKELPRAWFFSFESVENARKVLPEYSKYWQSLDGTWKFNWSPDPDERPADFYKPDYDATAWDDIAVPSNWNIVGIQKDGTLKYGTPIYVNQPVIFWHQVRPDDWRGGVMRTPPTNWTAFGNRNEVGSYRRDFEVPASWNGREVFISFDGVDSFFYLWINGHYVGFSKNSRNVARFNISKYLLKGRNTVAVEVYRSSDGSFLESQDMFRLPGIFRTVALYAENKVSVRNVNAIPDLSADCGQGSLAVRVDVRNLGTKEAKGCSVTCSLFENELYSDANEKLVASVTGAAPAAIAPGAEGEANAVVELKNPRCWSSEAPNRYTLVVELKDKGGKTLDIVSTVVGFRKVEIKDTPASEDEFGLAGRYYYINGKTVKLKGVNRHESNAATGHAISRETMEKEIMLMKRGNINHVRTCHYPDDPYWYYLCDKYGIYLESEANVESHEYYYGAASLSHPKEWEAAHVSRVMEMVEAYINCPSIVIWSLGNEGGPGHNYKAAYDAIKRVDLSRPVQYERNNDIVDMGSNQYPSIPWVREAVRGKMNIKYPFHISEYAHSMGNALGNFVDYWEAMESTNFFCGGAIWDWVDQSMYNYDPKTGERYHAYGGDFGDTPNDGQFVMNGIVFGDLTPKPQYYEVKKVHQDVAVKPVDMEKGVVEIFNKRYFRDFSDFDIRWSLYEDGVEKESGELTPGRILPRSKVRVTLPYHRDAMRADREYFAKVQFLLKEDMPWAKRGFVAMEEQLPVKGAAQWPTVAEAVVSLTHGRLNVTEGAVMGVKIVRGDGFEARFDMSSGTIFSLRYGHKMMIEEGKGPRLDAMRAFTNNDNWFYTRWFENGLHNLKHKALAGEVTTRGDGAVVLSFTVVSQAPNGAHILGGTASGKNQIVENTDNRFGENDFRFTTNQVWTVYPDGTIEFAAAITSNRPTLVLPRLGYEWRLPKRMENLTYYGRGPVDNYNDRKTGAFVELYKNTVEKEFVAFPKPQQTGNHEEVRWCALTDAEGDGLEFVATDPMSVSALPYSSIDMTLAGHPYQLPAVGDTYLHLDKGVTGLGGNSCGQGGPLNPDRVYAGHCEIGYIIRPASKDLSEAARVAPSGAVPVTILRNNLGDVTLSSPRGEGEICYSINDGEAKVYTQPFPFREKGTVKAWHKALPEVKSAMDFPRIEAIKTTVLNASSEEVDGGAAANLVDGDPSTAWFSMTSVTVAKFPHWIDLDAGEVKTVKGISYLPFQESNDGNIKEYTVQVSMDGKNWGDPVQHGAFANDLEEKKVFFKTPVKARYVRFTALNGHYHWADYASAAELTILAE